MKTTTEFYTGLRSQIGSRAYVSKLLGINNATLWRREIGAHKITEEMVLALMMLKSNHRKNP